MITVNSATLEAPAVDEDVTAGPDGLPTYLPGLDLRASAEGGDPQAGLMRRDANAVLDRLLVPPRNGTTDQAPAVMRQPVNHYLDPARWRQEVERIHRHVPLPLALSCELPAPG